MACIFHPERPEATSCARCRRLLCTECAELAIAGDGSLCALCRQREPISALPPPLGQPEASSSGRASDTARPAPEITGFFSKLQALVVSPVDLFARLREEGEGDWSFFLGVAWPSAVLLAAVRIALKMPSSRLSPGSMLLAGAVVVLLAPAILALVVVVQTALTHLTLQALGGTSRGFSASLRVGLHALAAYYLLGWIPLCGPWVGLAWSLILLSIGLRHMHRTTWPKAVAAA